MAAFLDDPAVSTLRASVGAEDGAITVANEVASPNERAPRGSYHLVLSKASPGALALEDLPGKLVVSSFAGRKELHAFYRAIKSVYAPLAAQQQSSSSGGGDDGGAADGLGLRALAKELEAGLGAAVRRGGKAKGRALDPAAAPLEGIVTPADEMAFWEDVAGSSAALPDARDAAKDVCREFDAVRGELKALSRGALDHEAALELVEAARDALDALWRLPGAGGAPAYPQRRMAHLLAVAGEAFQAYTRGRTARGGGLWPRAGNQGRAQQRARPQPELDGADAKPQGALSELRFAARLLGRWERAVSDLTAGLWPQAPEHPWQGTPHDTSREAAFAARCEDVVRILEAYTETNRLLGAEDVRVLRLEGAFSPLAACDALHVGGSADSAWAQAVAQYEALCAPAERRVGELLRERMASTVLPALSAAITQHGHRGAAAAAQPAQLFRELRRLGGLIARPAVAQALAQERDSLQRLAVGHLNNLRTDFEAQLAGAGSGGGGATATTTAAVARLAWEAQCRAKVAEAQATFSALLGGGEQSDFGLAAQELLRDLREGSARDLEEWKDETRHTLEDFSLETSGKIMHLDVSDGHVEVHFKPQLVALLREVRQLSALGLAVPREAARAAETANKFYRHAMVLKQVSNFYNNIGSEMLRCQKGLMLEDALRFEETIKNARSAMGQPLTWNNVSELEGYVERLQQASSELTGKNRRLRAYHARVRDKVAALMSVDLVRARDKWKEGIKDLRATFDAIQKTMELTPTDTREWRMHWDFQLYKVLEYQYQMGLECLNEHLPQMEARLIFRSRRLQFDPPLEQLRAAHYKHIKQFLNIPHSFRGVSEASFFGRMADGCGAAVARVFEHTEALFLRLQEEGKRLGEWVAVGALENLDAFVDEHCDEVADYEANFKALRERRRVAERVPLSVQVDCYLISLAPVRAAIEEQLKALHEALLGSLRRKAAADKAQIDEWMEEGRTMLAKQATSLEEIGEARTRAQALVANVAQVGTLKRKCEEKNRLLRQYAPTGAAAGLAAHLAPVDLSSLANDWDSFHQQLEQHGAQLEEQKDTLKAQIEREVAEFQARCESFGERWAQLKPQGVPEGDASLTLSKIDDYAASLDELTEEAARITGNSAAFSLDAPDFGELQRVKADIEETKEAWSMYGEFDAAKRAQLDKDWFSARARLFDVEDFLAEWAKRVKDRGGAGRDAVALLLLRELDGYKKALPLLKYARGDGYQPTHWAQMFALLGLAAGTKVEDLTLGTFLGKADALVAKADDLKALHAQAQGETVLREALEQLQVWGFERAFELVPHEAPAIGTGATKRTVLIKSWKELLSEVGDNQSLLNSLKDSPFFAPFRDEAGAWGKRLATLAEGLGQLNAIQRRWVYLQPIFGRGALPNEQGRFRKIDDEFRRIMGAVQADPLVVRLADFPRLLDILPGLAEQLERCQKALSKFLEDKRALFPRFYFLGDDDLLQILGQAKDPTVIQSHLKKLFAGVHSVKFTPDSRQIVAMHSAEGEVVPLATPVMVTDAVEEWLASLSTQMVSTLEGLLQRCLGEKDYDATPSQILGLADAIHFTQQAEQAIAQGTLSALHAKLSAQLREYTGLDVRGHRVLRLKIKALVLDMIHLVDVVDQLTAAGVRSLDDYAWYRQLRYYATKGGGAAVGMGSGHFDYTFEYQGNAPKLVYTPLTDKCYLTLTAAMHLGAGGNPYGPAGTGKTESVKALAQAMARQCLVFNCDASFDMHAMARIFVGLVKCGAWGCFDEFNRLVPECLSAVSTQIQTIQTALKQRADTMDFLGRQVPVNKNAGIFVTLNPAGKGYGGRSKLPDNLKSLFRAVAMSKPNNELIAEVMLLSEGYVHARSLGRKLVAVFNIAKALLSSQVQYDWGLRSIKTVLGISGKLLMAERDAQQATDPSAQPSEELEAQLVVRALRVTTLPKLAFRDVSRFNALVADVFRGVAVDDGGDAALDAAVREAMAELGLEVCQDQVDKVLQLQVALSQRIGVVVVGPSGCGKSALWRVLERALRKLPQGAPKLHVMNPKAVRREKLLGYMDPDTREMHDGVLVAAARQVVRESLDTHSWIVIDGDVDPEWIEALNSVLDDNKLMTLPNGERIQFGNNVNFLFETHSLDFASPATVSRMGMICLSEEALDARVLVRKWLSALDDEARPMAERCTDQLFTRALEWAKARAPAVPTTRAGLILNALSHLPRNAHATPRDFAVGVARGFGANLPLVAREQLYAEVQRWSGEALMDDLLRPAAACTDTDAFDFDADEGVNEADDEGSEGGKAGGAAASGGPRLVPTADMRAAAAMVLPWLRRGEPLILAGPEGAGKSTLLRWCFERLHGAAVATIDCSAQTDSRTVLQKLAQMCGSPATTATGRVLRPRDSERLVLYLREVNLCRPDEYATVELVSFLQQLVTYNGFYDDALEFISLERISIVCTMNPVTTAGRHELTTRFTAIVRLGYMSYPDREQLGAVYSRTLRGVLRIAGASGEWAGDAAVAKLSGALLDVYEGMLEAFSADTHRHYQLTPRDITEWVLSLQRYDCANGGALGVLESLAHAGWRQFGDRLVGEEDAARFDGILVDVLRKHWGHTLDARDAIYTTLTGLPGASQGQSGGLPAPPQLVRLGLDDYVPLVEDLLMRYEREFKQLGILLFPDVVQRIARIERALSGPGGCLLLCGPSGVGRRSCVTLVAYALRMELVTLKMTRGYDLKALRADLKALMLRAGVEGEAVVLLAEDHNLAEDAAFLECFNSLLSGGELPGLFSADELDTLLAPLREPYSTHGFGFTSLYDFFVARVRANLRVVLLLDPSNEGYAARCESNPALFTRCTLLWAEGWSARGMEMVPERLLRDVMAESQEDADEHIVAQMGRIHATQLPEGATPRQFVAFVSTYANLFSTKRAALLKQRASTSSGLTKLAEAETTVDELSREAQRQRVLLGEKQEQAEQALEQITVAMQSASDSRNEVTVLQQRLGTEEAELNARKGDVQTELAEIQPMVDAARAAVGQIKSNNLTEIRSLKVPPDPIRDVLEGVIRLFGSADTSWTAMKKFLGQRGVKESILNFDPHDITPDARDAVERLLKQKGNSFEHAVIYKSSVAAAPLAAWVKANVKYSYILTKIGPLEREMAHLQDSLAESTMRLRRCEEDLATLDERVAALKTDFQQRTMEAEQLKFGLQRATDQLGAAQSLLSKLGGEKSRWERQVRALSEDVVALPLKMMLAAAFITYLAPHPEEKRATYLAEWARDIGLEGFDLPRFLSSESEMLLWKAQGLPSDPLSMANALCVLNASQPPLIVDPTSKTADWLEAHLRAADKGSVESVALHDERFANALELAVRFGKTLIVREADRVDPILYPILRRDLVRQGPRLAVQVGDRQVDFNEDFRLFLVTRSPAPSLPPDATHLVTRTDCNVTKGGLESQLLGVAITHEQPELEQQKSELLRKEEGLRLELVALEETLLSELASSEGNLLENTALIKSLEETKVKAVTIERSLAEAHELQFTLDAQRGVYKPLARRGAMLYFLLMDLRGVSHMYRFSLAVFQRLFERALDSEAPTSSVEARMSVLMSNLLSIVHAYVARTLFKADRLTFGMHLAHAVAPAVAHGWEHFLGTAGVDTRGVRAPAWVPRERVAQYASLSTAFPDVAAACSGGDGSAWATWVREEAPEARFPPAVASAGALARLMLVDAVRPDRTQAAMEAFVCEAMGVRSLAAPATSLAKLHAETLPNEPVVFVTSTGSDPSQELEEFAVRMVGPERYKQIAMGQGQEEPALALLRECARSGEWLCLKNLHLAIAFLPSLEKELVALEPHEGFRLFCTTQEHDSIPASLLENALKVSYESPPGIKKNLQRTYDAWPSTFISQGSSVRAQLLFCLAWFNAVVQERRNFGTSAFSKFYEFSFADLRCGGDIVDTAAGDGGGVRWEYIHGLLSQAIYGGRVDNPQDARVLRAYLRQYFCQEAVSGRPMPGTSVMLPTSANHRDYAQLISALPESDAPALFSLSPNVSRTVQQAAAERVRSGLRGLSSSAQGTAGVDRQRWAERLGPAMRQWEQIMSAYPALGEAFRAASGRGRGGGGEVSPIAAFVELEGAFGRQVVHLIHKSLASIGGVLSGRDMLTAEVKADAEALLASRVPARWEALWEGPAAPLAYCRAAATRAQAGDRWQGMVSQGALLSGEALDLGELFTPGRFLMALRQEAGRALGVPLEALRLASTFGASQAPAGGALLRNLWVEGAAVAGGSLAEVASDAPPLSEAPQCAISFVQDDGAAADRASLDRLPVPLYVDTSRAAALCDLEVECAASQVDSWTLHSPAFFLAQGQ